MPTHAATPSAKAKEFATRMINDYGRICGRRAVIPHSQAELARRYQLSASTLNWYLRELGPAVLERRPHLVLDTDTLASAPPPGDQAGAPATALASVTSVQGLRSDELVPLVVELLDVVGRILRSATAPRPATEAAVDPRVSVAESANLEELFSQEFENILLTDSFDPATSPRPPAKPRPATAEPMLTGVEIDLLIAPLEELARRHRLVPVSNRRRLHAALSPYTAGQLTVAVHRLCRQIGAGVAIRSPFGVLIHHAAAPDSDLYDENAGPATQSTPTPPRAAGQSECADADVVGLDVDQASAAVAEMIADPIRWSAELAALDDIVDQRLAASTNSFADQLRRIGPMRDALRVDAYRTLHPQSEEPT